MPEEIGETLKNLEDIKKISFGDLEIISGNWKNNENKIDQILISIAWSGWGKVSASRAATRLIAFTNKDLPVSLLLFTGVAGAACSELKQWDIVIPTKLVQHDMDARPIYEKFVIPALNTKDLYPDRDLSKWTFETLSRFIERDSSENFGKIYKGVIATGDQFISDQDKSYNLKKEISGLTALEMEGAAVAQVALQESVPFQIIRVISDSANDSSPQEFGEFIKIYNKCAHKLVAELIDNLITDESPLN